MPSSPDPRGLAAPLILVAARGRRRPGRWLLPAVGLALAAAFAGTVAAEGTIAGDLAARATLRSLDALDRSVRVTWQGPDGGGADRRAQALLHGLGLDAQTRVVLLSGVRLGGVVVRPAGIAPLAAWVRGRVAATLGRCRGGACPVVAVSGALPARRLGAPGVSLAIAARAALRSAAALGFTPGPGSGPPVLLSSDPRGLNAVAALGGVYRSQSRLAVLPLATLHSWQLVALVRRLQDAQAELAPAGADLALSAPFAALNRARALAATAPRRLLPAGGGALAALAMFVVLAAYGLRRDQQSELERLRTAGGRTGQLLLFALAEAAALAAAALVAGAALGVLVAALLAGRAGIPVGGALSHSLLSGTGAAALGGGWALATVMIGLVLTLPGGRAADLLAAAAAAALALTLSQGAGSGGALPALLAPLACLAGGVLVYRLAAGLLRSGERALRHGPVLARLALIGLARAPVAPGLAIAFVTVATGLSGFALGYRATLLRGAADQAADVVPLDATIGPSAAFATPLQRAPLTRWRALAGGPVWPVRRTYAEYTSAGAAVAVPALGVPAAALGRIRGWRANDGPAPPGELGRRLLGPVSTRRRGLMLRAGSRRIALRVTAAAPVTVTADLRARDGGVIQVALGAASPRARTLRARLSGAPVELEALELGQPAGLQATSGHQNSENPAAATQGSAAVSLGPVRVTGPGGVPLMTGHLGAWRAVGAASDARRTGPGLLVRFAESGGAGIIRPRQPGDTRPVPVLAAPAVAGAAGGDGRIALTVDGVAVPGAIVGVVRRFPTLAPDVRGFVVADQAALASALDAAQPGQGRPDELWVAGSRLGRLQRALAAGRLSGLTLTLRAAVQRRLGSDPIARGVLGTLAAGAGLAAALLGLGPRARRGELRVRVAIAASLGVLTGALLAAGLTRLTVAAVGAAGPSMPVPPLVTVAPWGELALGALTALAALAVTAELAVRTPALRRALR